MSIITDKNKLAKTADATIQAYKNVGQDMHNVIVSAIWHGAKHGDVTVLNRVFKALRPNDQTAVKLFVLRATLLTGMVLAEVTPKISEDSPMTTEAKNTFKAKGLVIDFEKGNFFVVQDTAEAREKLIALCEKRFIEPSLEWNDKFVFDRENIKEIRTIGDADALKAVERALKNVLGDSTDTKVKNLSPKVADFLKDLKGKVEAFSQTSQQQANLADAA